MESVAVALAKEIEHRHTATAIGTVLALRSITLRNELPGTVREVSLTPGHIVDTCRVLVALDVSVEEAELNAQEAQAALARTVLNRRKNLSHDRATTQEEVDRARADLDIALAQIARKTIRAPFRARVGMADVHPGQYLTEGTQLTTLQGVDDAVHVDFTVAQQVAATSREGDTAEVSTAGLSSPIAAHIVTVDAQYEQTILVAFREVEDALVAVKTAREQRAAQAEQVEALRSALQLASLRYKGGLANYLDVLVAQRNLFDAELALTSTHRLQLVSVVQLYKALGGGWHAYGTASNPSTPTQTRPLGNT